MVGIKVAAFHLQNNKERQKNISYSTKHKMQFLVSMVFVNLSEILVGSFHLSLFNSCVHNEGEGSQAFLPA